MKIDLIAGARPNFVKIAALYHANVELGNLLEIRIIHTGQHYDDSLSGSFFKQLDLPEPAINLHVGSGSQAEQTAAIMIAYERVLLKEKPELCIVVGDVTSSFACAVTAKKLDVKVAHVEAGIRSYDWKMPEEVNRVLIDSISDYFFTTTPSASSNLLKTGIPADRIFFVGNTMIDTLVRFRSKFQEPQIARRLKLKDKNYLIVTLHRPGNVDENQLLKKIIGEILKHSRGVPVIFPVHPRTARGLEKLELESFENLYMIEPLSYLEFNFLVQRAKAVITDSGGVTEETTVFGVPCITLRENTERPETITIGTNELVGADPRAIAPVLKKLYEDNWKRGGVPELWDGKAGERIVQSVLSLEI